MALANQPSPVPLLHHLMDEEGEGADEDMAEGTRRDAAAMEAEEETETVEESPPSLSRATPRT